jgi:8-oxo-dGTP pyrophosphatase MutT (NUDIX family)
MQKSENIKQEDEQEAQESKGDFVYLDEAQLYYYEHTSEHGDGDGDGETTEPSENEERFDVNTATPITNNTNVATKLTTVTNAIDIPCMDKQKKYRNVYCVNCGEKGHVVRDCDGPITSFGILAFKVANNSREEQGDTNSQLNAILHLVAVKKRETEAEYPKIKFLMIQRKDTMGYIDFVRGKYPDNDANAKERLLKVCLHEMIPEEKTNLLTKTFDQLWCELWLNKNSKTFKNEYAQAKSKFEKLDVKTLVTASKTCYTHTEFGFAKGRRNMRESNIACAEREFFEETGYTKLHYDFIKHYPTIHEEFIGTNGIRYRHIYYLVKMKDNAPPPKVDTNNILQTGEVQNLGWFTFEEVLGLIRPYDTAKKRVIDKVNRDILNMKGNFVCSNFYYNTKRTYFPSTSPVHDYSLSNYWKSHSL